MSSARRRRPDRPYVRIPVRRLVMECNRRLAGTHGPRAFELVAALIARWPNVQSGIVYLGDERMGELMHRCGRTAHRAKYDLARVGLIRLHGAGPRRCPCPRCGGEKAGGSITVAHPNGKLETVSAATGYELDPDLLRPPVRRPGPPAGPSTYVSPYEARVRAEGRAKIERALAAVKANLEARAGP